MKIEECLILGAGMGTRMGEIGKSLPKILWPIFDMPLLKLQVSYARELGCRKIFTNTHFLSEKVEAYIRSENWSDVIVCHEPTLLDVGGGIQNVASKCRGDLLLVLNGDLFLFLDKKDFSKVPPSSECHLFAIPVDPKEKYNILDLKDGRLQKICPPNGNEESALTYSGVSIVNLNKLKRIEGPSGFFDTVANPTNSIVTVSVPLNAEYWDFGTLSRYTSSICKLFNDLMDGNKKSAMAELCLRHHAAEEKSINSKTHSYATSVPNVLNFSGKQLKIKNESRESCIILDAQKDITFEKSGVYWNGISANA